MLSMGVRWTTEGNPSAGLSPPRRAGDPGGCTERGERGDETVELGVRDRRVVVDIVFPLVADDLPAQRFDSGAVPRAGLRGGHVFPPNFGYPRPRPRAGGGA